MLRAEVGGQLIPKLVNLGGDLSEWPALILGSRVVRLVPEHRFGQPHHVRPPLTAEAEPLAVRPATQTVPVIETGRQGTHSLPEQLTDEEETCRARAASYGLVYHLVEGCVIERQAGPLVEGWSA
jgi:hypothetical protein